MNWKTSADTSRPIAGCQRVEAVAHIRNNSTGEVRLYKTDELLEDGSPHPNTFIWEEGNYSCDCNRALFFGYALNQQWEDIDHPCGEGGFSVALQNPVTGLFYYNEFTPAPCNPPSPIG
jgi:hypothetical protein